MPGVVSESIAGTPRRHQPAIASTCSAPVSRRRAIVAAPSPLPAEPPRPHGDLELATVDQIADVFDQVWPASKGRRYQRRRGLKILLGHLEQQAGRTWQQRWVEAGLNEPGAPVRALVTSQQERVFITYATQLLFCLRVIRPSLAAFRGNDFRNYAGRFEHAQRDADLDHFVTRVEAQPATDLVKRFARLDVAAALTSQGIAYRDLTPEAFLHYAIQTRRGRYGYGYTRYIGHLAWTVLRETGQFTAAAPTTMRAALKSPPMTAAELVTAANIRDPAVAGLLTDYLSRRALEIDHSSLQALSRHLCHLFWNQLVEINPQQRDLALSADLFRRWRAQIAVRKDGQLRLTADAVVITVRSFYLDLQAWAVTEPDRWGSWVVPCPITTKDLRSNRVARRRTKDRMDNRTRLLQPLLPILIDATRADRDHHAELLTAAGAAKNGQLIAVGSRIYRRLHGVGDEQHARRYGAANVRVMDQSTGQQINVTRSEELAFWIWAAVEVLRQTGVRIEELLELTQLSIRQYQRPNGEVIALLVIAPSKTDRERVIPMSAELFHVVATILRRLTAGRGSVPLVTSFDVHEHLTSDPEPFLFQTRTGQQPEAITPSAVRINLRKLCRRLASKSPQLATCQFTPHDFRRLFATDLINHGLPIHIGAALLGHLNLQTTLGYVTVFSEDTVRHYQDHLARRRASRATEEYRPVNHEEWTEFEQHFDKRKVELGKCGRPYGTPCQHEHACIRCPMLQVDPAMAPRLEEIGADLITRRAHAEAEGWLGEIEGIDLTLRFVAEKRAELNRSGPGGPVDIGMPSRGSRS